jgi:2-oxo-4-hydroxy-4-carboxy-5-ureidoimidazoline decarboxylase
MTIEEVNALGLRQFVDLLGGIYEHSPWVAEGIWRKRPFYSGDQLRALMQLEVETASRERQLTLLRAHPDLGTRAKIGEFSAREQNGAGLDQLTPLEYKTLLHLNQEYRARFGFPFIYAVRGNNKHDVLVALAERLESSPEDEFAQALHQVHRIAAFRLEDLIKQTVIEPQ